ncbi:MAG: lamin tail domain-containing protein, partial [Flavobacteriales bacterium]
MKKALLSTFLLILAISSSSILIAQVTENFDLFINGSYGNHTYNGWEITNGLSQTASKSYLGTGRSIRLRNSGSPSLQSPSKPNGIGTVSFWYRTWDGAPAISKVYIEISDDSTTWSKVDSLASLTNQTYVNYIKIINSPTAKFLRITPSTEERLLLDEFSISDNASGCSGFHRDTVELTICSFDSINFRGTFYSSAGYYNDTLYSTCDTIFTLNLNSTAYTEYEVFDTICSENDSLLFNGSYLKSAGTYYDTISRVGDCDSVIKLELSLKYCHIPCADLFISEYYEGSSGNNKAIEIYNPTNSTVDLSNYSLIKYTNGGPSITTINLSGMLASNDVYVITHSSADSGAITFHADLRNSSVISFNG